MSQRCAGDESAHAVTDDVDGSVTGISRQGLDVRGCTGTEYVEITEFVAPGRGVDPGPAALLEPGSDREHAGARPKEAVEAERYSRRQTGAAFPPLRV